MNNLHVRLREDACPIAVQAFLRDLRSAGVRTNNVRRAYSVHNKVYEPGRPVRYRLELETGKLVEASSELFEDVR